MNSNGSSSLLTYVSEFRGAFSSLLFIKFPLLGQMELDIRTSGFYQVAQLLIFKE